MVYSVRLEGLSQGLACKLARVARGLTLAEVAERTGVNVSSVSRFENNEFTSYRLVDFYQSLFGRYFPPTIPVEKFEKNMDISIYLYEEDD